ncbi:MAG: SCO family protein, partial [Chromatiales bacterium]|nr:SCO family protein [Chromatiales bacterium]
MLRSLLLIATLLCSSFVTAESARPEDEVLGVSEVPPGGDFTLRSSKGDFSLTDLRGKVALLYFGYTNCPDVCPTG